MTTAYSIPRRRLPLRAAVNRESEKEHLKQAIERLRSLGSIFQTVYELTGSPGIGKTVIVEMLKDWCDGQEIAYISLDFDPERNPNASQYPKNYGLMIADLIAGAHSLDLADVSEDLPVDNSREAARRFLDVLLKQSRERPIVLFCDETERLTSDQAEWLEEWVVNPLAQTGRIIVVWAGRRPQRWVRYELRRRLHSQQVDPFNDANIKELMDRRGAPVYVQQETSRRLLLRMTEGNPLALNIALDHIKPIGEKSKPPSEEALRQQLLEPLVTEFIENFAFKGLKPDERLACQPLAVVRQFDAILLRKLLAGSTDVFQSYSREAFGVLLNNLREREVVQWDERRKGYALDPAVRSILSLSLMENNPDFYRRANTIAMEVYQDWIRRAGDNRMLYIVEELYQQACLNRLSSRVNGLKPVSLVGLLNSMLDEYQQNDPDLRFSALNILYHELERDADLKDLNGEEWNGLLKLTRIAQDKAIG